MANPTVLSIYHLRPRRIGGIESMARELSLQLSRHGWQSVLCFAASPPQPVREFLDLPNVSIEVLSDWRTWSWRFNWELARLLRRHRPAVVHLNFTDLLGPQVRLARLLGARRVCFTDHVSRPAEFQPQPVSWWKRAVYRLAVPISRVFCVSDYVRRCGIESRRYPPERYCTLYNGIDIDRAREGHRQANCFRERFGLSAEHIVVAQVAKMISEKGFVTLLKAAQSVAASHHNVRFLLVGDGPERARYQTMVDELGLSHCVQLTGLIDDPVGEGLFAAADIVRQASVWNEAFGLVIAEGMASGRPVVATRVGGIPELVRDGQTGYLVDRDDAPALADRISQLVGDAELRKSLGRAGRQACEELFDQRTIASRLIGQYELVTNGTA